MRQRPRRPTWGLRGGDRVHELTAAGNRGDGVEVSVDIEFGDRANPSRATARRVGQMVHPGLAQVSVVTLDVAADQLLDVGFRAVGRSHAGQPLDDAAVLDLLKVQIARQAVGRHTEGTVRGGVRSQVAGTLGVDGQVGIGQKADVVLGRRVSVAEAQAVEVGCLDVRNAVLRVPDDHLTA